MKKSRFSESQIVAVLKEGEAGIPVAQLTRKHGISAATYYHWKSKYGGASMHELKRLRELEAENARLKDALAHAQRLANVGQLASSITHEFNNILTTVINYAKMGLRHKDPASQRSLRTEDREEDVSEFRCLF